MKEYEKQNSIKHLSIVLIFDQIRQSIINYLQNFTKQDINDIFFQVLAPNAVSNLSDCTNFLNDPKGFINETLKKNVLPFSACKKLDGKIDFPILEL